MLLDVRAKFSICDNDLWILRVENLTEDPLKTEESLGNCVDTMEPRILFGISGIHTFLLNDTFSVKVAQYCQSLGLSEHCVGQHNPNFIFQAFGMCEDPLPFAGSLHT